MIDRRFGTPDLMQGLRVVWQDRGCMAQPCRRRWAVSNPRTPSRSVSVEREITHRRAILYEQAGRVIVAAIRWGGLTTMVYFFASSLAQMAGTNTSVDVALDALASLSAPEWLAYVVGGSGIGYGYLQQREKRKKTEAMAARIADLERRVDPKRTSSRLMPDGRTNPNDD